MQHICRTSFLYNTSKGFLLTRKKKDGVITATVTHVNMIICDAWKTLPFNNLIISRTIAVWSENQVSKFRKSKVKQMTHRKHYFFVCMYYLCVCVCVWTSSYVSFYPPVPVFSASTSGCNLVLFFYSLTPHSSLCGRQKWMPPYKQIFELWSTLQPLLLFSVNQIAC